MASLLEAGVGCESQIADINVLPEWDSVGREETVAEPQGASQAFSQTDCLILTFLNSFLFFSFFYPFFPSSLSQVTS